MTGTNSFRGYLTSALILALVGWGGLAALLKYTLPTIWPRWAFFFLWVLALTGTALPFTYFFNRRYLAAALSDPQVIVRQALWAGIYGATVAWLQLGRLVTFWVIVSLAAGLIAVEYFIRLRELARRKPLYVQARSEAPEPDGPAS